MKAASALILYFIVLLFNFHGILGEALLMDFVDSQLSGPTPCNVSSHCHHLKNAVCVNSYCNCNGTKFCVSNFEQKVLKLGQKCKSSSDCLIRNSECLEGKCRCQEGTAADISGRKCTKSEEPKIQCMDGYVLNYASTECLKIAGELNSACHEDVQCISQFENSVCHEGLCRCKENLELNATEKMCIPSLSFSIGSLNETDSGTPTGCVDGICKEQEVEPSPKADNSCIGGLCDGFQKEENIGCTVGRCECPEEKEFCTNRAELSSQVHKGRRIEQPDSGESSADNPKIVHISETYVFGRVQEEFRKFTEYFVSKVGSFAGVLTLTTVVFAVQTMCAYSNWRGTVAFFVLMLVLNCSLLYLVCRLELSQLAYIYYCIGALPCFGFLFFMAFFAILERVERIHHLEES